MNLLIIIAVIAVIGMWFISEQRKLVSHDEICQNAMSSIGVQQQTRWDALITLADMVRSYNEHEYVTLKDVISMRRDINGTSSAEEANEQEQVMSNLLVSLKAIGEQYPELKANENYARIMEDLKVYEEQVRQSRMIYNDTVTRYNKLIRQIPDNIVASMLGFKIKAYLETPKEKTDMPKLNL